MNEHLEYILNLIIRNIFLILSIIGLITLIRTFNIKFWRKFYTKFFGKRQKNPLDLNVKDFVNTFALDIGGTMTKVVYIDLETKEDKIKKLKEIGVKMDENEVTKHTITTKNIPEFIEFCPEFSSHALEIPFGDNGVMKFLKYPSNELKGFLKFVKENNLVSRFGGSSNKCNATGGGSFKFSKIVKEEANIEFIQRDEMESLILGLNFLFSLRTKEPPIFRYVDKECVPVFFKSKLNLYPYLFVQIGSGTIEDKKTYKRVSGSSIGGGTFSGLSRLITGTKDYNKWISDSKHSENSHVDLMVRDIYGSDYSQHGLKGDVIAASFGKVATMKTTDEKQVQESFNHGDAVKSLLFMISNNIAQLSILNAEKYRARNVFFSGGFIRKNEHVWSKLSFAMNFWSQGKTQAMFVRHDGYLGAIGSFIQK